MIFIRLIFFVVFSNFLVGNLKLSELDSLRALTVSNSTSIISSGSDLCNKFFEENKNLNTNPKKFKNFFLCKFSEKRNRFYIYMLSVERDYAFSLKENCLQIIQNWPWIADHMDEKYSYQEKDYLSGFFIENLFNNEVLKVSDNVFIDEQILNNELNRLIIANRNNFSEDNDKNNDFLQDQINSLNRIYKKVKNKEISDLDILIKNELDKITRYKIFINDIKKFKSYSCNWKPGKGLNPYIKLETYKEFENI